MSQPEAESQLIQRLYDRDEKAMTLFYNQYKSALYHTIWRTVRQNELAEDILQEAMLKFWLAFPTYDPSKGRLYTWVRRISRNLAIDRLREQQRTSPRTTHSLSAEVAAYLVAPVAFYPEHIGVRDWLTLLSPRDRQVSELLYLQGYTQAEVAQELIIPLGTIKSSSRRSIRALTRRLYPA